MIESIDHIVLTVRDTEAAARFYAHVLGMHIETFGGHRTALHFGTQKINLQTPEQETRNHACIGSGDLCLITGWSPDKAAKHLRSKEVEIIEGPVEKSGARGPITSIYFNDPDGNLIEVASYEREPR